jgi:hypothetical protein
LFVPDHVQETFRPSTDHGGHDRGGRGLRYLEWTTGPGPGGSTYSVDFAFLLREADGTVQVDGDRHTCGLLAAAGFEPREVPPDGRPDDLAGHPMFVARRPG